MLISKCHLMGRFRAMGSLMSPRVIIPPCPPSLGGPALQYTLGSTVHLLSQYKSSLCYYRTDSDSRRVARIWKRGGGFFERVRKVQTILTRIFVVLESVSHGCPKTETKFLGKLRNSNVFSAQNQVVSKKKKKKKRSSPKLRLIFRPNSEIHTYEGGCFPMGGLFLIFHKKSASKAPKTCDFAYFTSQWGGSSPPPPPLATLLSDRSSTFISSSSR